MIEYMDFLPDIPRLYTGIAEWLACMLFVCAVRKRQLSAKQVALMFGALGVQIALQHIVGMFPLSLWVFGMFINIVWMYLVLLFFNKTTAFKTVFTVTKAFIVSELLASVGWQLYTLFVYRAPIDSALSMFVINVGVYVVIVAGLFRLENSIDSSKFQYSLTNQTVWIAFYAGCMVFLLSNIGFLLHRTGVQIGSSHAIFLIRTIANVSGVAILYMVQLQTIDQSNKRELSAVNSLFQNQYEQYKAYARSTHYINRKAHDLKHQIGIIMAEDNHEKRQTYIAELQQAIHQLSTKIETGNGVLDTILTQKNMHCAEHDINFTCIANGHLLHSLNIMDLCSLFGNALDNAIEHVEKIPEVEKRLITLKLSNQGQMVILRVDNYCVDVDFQEGILPQTSKTDNQEDHGFGLRSIEYIAKKYGGHMNISVEDNWFSLKVVFPITGHS
ncbi:MAG: GHKL domain-containing protein [Aerococcaceae bacterium]|nr:GHKL domain-containing protein [Aerococcaceae bacterium]